MADVELELSDEDLVRALSLGRVAVGVAAFIAPKRFVRAWTGERTRTTATSLATRSLGARDVAIGLGTLLALERDEPVKRWIQAQVVADGTDALGTLANFRDLPPFRRWLSLAAAGGACLLGLRLQRSFE
ncbi:MAG: hypothetical protein ACR2KQ_08285 [Actinomycetota bacterium]